MSDPPTMVTVHQAAKEGNIALLKKASKKELNRGDEDGWTPVHWTAWNGNTEALQIVLSKGGDLDKGETHGSSPLHIAASYGHVGAIELMINNGANLWALDNNGRTAAKCAAFHKKIDACRYLDTLAVRWEAQSKEYVEKMQLKAMKDLKKRVKEASKEEKVAKKLVYDHATAPAGASPLTRERKVMSGSLTTVEVGGKKKKLSPRDALRENFELRPSQSTGNVEEGNENLAHSGEEDGPLSTHSAGSTFRPVPRMNVGPLLNTLQSLTQNPLGEVRKMSLESGLGKSVSAASSEATPSTSPRNSDGALLQLQMVPSSGSMIVENDSTLTTFLQSLDLIDCVQLLHKEKLDLDALALCNEKDLISIGLPLGPRKKILHAVERRKQLIAAPGRMTDTDL